MTSSEPSLTKIILRSYSTFLVVLFAVVAWLLSAVLAVSLLGPAVKDRAHALEGVQSALFLAIAGSLFAGLFVMLRVRAYRRRFAEGVEVPGIITFVFSWRGRASVRYAYDYMGQSYKGSGSVMRLTYGRPLRTGTAVTLLVDPQDPKRSLVRDFFV